MILRKAVLLPILVILSIQGVIVSVLYYQKQSDKISSYLTSQTGMVAGASTSEIIDLSKEIPIMPNANISGVDTSQNSASITLDSSLPENEIKTYYDDYLLLNDWSQISNNTYRKNNKELKVEVIGNIIKLTLTNL